MMPIGQVKFVDGTIREVFSDADGRQYVLDDDWVPVYGVWLAPAEDLADVPAVVSVVKPAPSIGPTK